MALDERAYWAALRAVPHVGPVRFQRLLERFGTLEAAWGATPEALRQALDERAAASLLANRGRLEPSKLQERIEHLGIRIVTLLDADYPWLLSQIPAPPPVLFLRGQSLDWQMPAVAIVGTRRTTAYGREVALSLARDLAAAGVLVISGLARGIDAIAHQGALEANGQTVAVLASGVDVIYPPEHRNLAERICGSGALLSDYLPGTKPDAPNFPARNRLISGLSLGTVVVEAPSRSGALITASFAGDQGREVFVVPGSVLSSASVGVHRLLRDGARAVTSAGDILDDLGLLAARTQEPVQAPLDLSPDERRLMTLVTTEPQHLDELAAAAGISAGPAAALMTMLELKGLVLNGGAQHYSLAGGRLAGKQRS